MGTMKELSVGMPKSGLVAAANNVLNKINESMEHRGLDQIELEKVLEHLEKNPELIPKKILLGRIREIVTDVGNEGGTENQSSLGNLYRDCPEEKMLIDAVLNQVAIMCGYKLLRDDMISEAVRDIRDNSKANAKGIWNWMKRVWRAIWNLDAHQVTRLTRECEKMAAKHEALKKEIGLEKASIEYYKKLGQENNIATEKSAQEFMEKSNLELQKNLQEVRAQALATQQRAIDQAQELTKDSGARAERMQLESNRKLAEIENKIEAKEKELTLKKTLTAEFDKNPDVVKEWEKKNTTNEYKNAQVITFYEDSHTNKWLLENKDKVEVINVLYTGNGYNSTIYTKIIFRWLVKPLEAKELSNEKVVEKPAVENLFLTNPSSGLPIV